MRNSVHTFRKNRLKGQAMLELALVLPIFMFLIIGIFEVAFIFFYNISVSNASREAARYAASSGTCKTSEGCTGTNGVLYYRDCVGIRNRAISKSPGLGLTAANIVISYDHGPNDSGVISPIAQGCSSSAPTLVTGDRVVIEVTKQFVLIIPIPGLSNFDIKSKTYRTILLKVD